ncbi:hypothetical protein FOMPIDRAFT_1056168 [Fomitopsis schrenkii]|uniref:DNA 3'-5' helicase n=1 Tax=Fomitopsis schrenkii TaxID=2126942 RepID=S8DKD4_FOMSC|nr:hypothetical protein FOMPIDRAFT_1056168 [Fomitopsis schrenkii]
MPVASKIAQEPTVLCQGSRHHFADALAIARAAAHESRKYDSEAQRRTIRGPASDALGGKEPYKWQVDVCEAMLLGLDCIVIAGTGAGKTMPFVMPLLVDETKQKMVLVISPLNELEQDQAKRFRDMGVTATAINRDVYTNALHKEIQDRKHRVLLMGPEMALEHPHFSKLLRSPDFAAGVAAIIIDEAHCITEWGADFRPKFAELSRLRALVPTGVPFLAASATLPPLALADIQRKLAFHSHSTYLVNLGNDRANITPIVVQMSSANDLSALDFVVHEALPVNGGNLLKTVIFFNDRDTSYRAYSRLKNLLPENL